MRTNDHGICIWCGKPADEGDQPDCERIAQAYAAQRFDLANQADLRQLIAWQETGKLPSFV